MPHSAIQWRYVAPVKPPTPTRQPRKRRSKKSFRALHHIAFGNCEILARRWLVSGIAVVDTRLADGTERTLSLQPQYWTDDIAELIAQMSETDFQSDPFPQEPRPDQADEADSIEAVVSDKEHEEEIAK